MPDIRADEVCVGHTVTAIKSSGFSRWRKRPIVIEERLKAKRGKWPTVVEATHWTRGEGDEPTVYLKLSDDARGVYPLRPGDTVTVVEG